MNTRRVPSNSWAWLLGMSVTMFVLLLPFFRVNVKHHPDERHYTTAGIEMVQSGDWMTPKTATGQLRLKKPIASYWFVAASYQILGISVFSSRIAFVVLGIGMVPLTFWLGYRLSGSREIGLFSAFLLMSNPALLITMCQSMPDIVMAFFLVLSMVGIIEWQSAARSSQRKFFWIAVAYVGMTFAILAKGMPAVVFGGTITAVLIGQSLVLRENVWTFVAGFVVSLGLSSLWFVLMWSQHGNAILSQFFGDQIGERAAENWYAPVVHVFSLAMWIGVSLLPWVSLIVDRLRQRRSKSIRWFRFFLGPQALLVSWICVFLVSAIFVSRVNLRYQIAIMPFVCVLLANWIWSLPVEQREYRFKLISRTAVMAIALFAITVAPFGVAQGERVWIAVVAVIVCGSVGGAVWSYGHKSNWQTQAYVTAFSVIAVFPLLTLGVARYTQPTAEQVVAGIVLENMTDNEIGVLGIVLKWCGCV